jgi:hypothetical protein
MVVNGLIAITVMAFAGNVSAQTYDIQNGNILAIEDLFLNFDNEEFDDFYDIEFVTDTGVNQYGDADNPTFDFMLSENGVTAMLQIIDALNAANPPVTGASATGSDTFFIPLVRIPIPFVGTAWGASGGEIFFDGTWDGCQTDCLVGSRPLGPDNVNTFARVTLVPEPGVELVHGAALLTLAALAMGRRRAL